MEKKEEERKVAPIRVVNLASLQDIKVVKKDTPTTRPNRRKSVHQVRSNSMEQMEIIEGQPNLNTDDSSNSTIASTSNSTIHRLTLSKKVFPKTTQPESRPNENLMKRVAFLRVCAEYMLNELNIDNVSIGENQSLEMLKAQYFKKWEEDREKSKTNRHSLQ